MDARRPIDPLTDAALDHEIETALDVKPSPEFLARVRAHIASEPAPSEWRSPWRLAIVSTIPVAVVVIAIVLMWQGGKPASAPSEERREARVTDARGPVENTAAAASSPSVSGVPRVVPVPGRNSVRGLQVAARRAEPEVVISPEEAAAWRQLFEDISTRRVESALLPETMPAPLQLAPIREIAIEPIKVELLTPIGSE